MWNVSIESVQVSNLITPSPSSSSSSSSPSFDFIFIFIFILTSFHPHSIIMGATTYSKHMGYLDFGKSRQGPLPPLPYSKLSSNPRFGKPKLLGNPKFRSPKSGFLGTLNTVRSTYFSLFLWYWSKMNEWLISKQLINFIFLILISSSNTFIVEHLSKSVKVGLKQSKKMWLKNITYLFVFFLSYLLKSIHIFFPFFF